VPPVENPQKLIHELQVYQIELEMQNEEIRRQQAETEEAKDRYRGLYDFSPIGHFAFDPEGTIEEVNLTGASLLGRPRSQLIGKPFFRFLERNFSTPFDMHLKAVFGSNVRQTCELKIRQKPDKPSIYVSLESIAAEENDGIKCRSAIMDIDQRKQMEEALREYEGVIENSRDIVTVLDRNYRYVLANAQFLKYQGLDRSRVIGRSIRDIAGKDAFETVVKKNLDACFRGEAVQYETKRAYPDLGERDLLVRYLPVENPGGGVSRIVNIIQDITERKRAERVAQARLRIANTVSLSVDEILQKALDEIESATGSRIGFYHFLEADQETLSLQNWSTNTVQNMCTAEGKGTHYPISKAGVWVECVHERRPVIHNDFASLPHRKGMPPGHAPVIREMLIPILRDGQSVAIIGVGNKPTDYDATDVEIASLLGDFS
jgi:PAS domain S-box-containing protein